MTRGNEKNKPRKTKRKRKVAQQDGEHGFTLSNFKAFLFESVFQVITWVCIGACFLSASIFVSKDNLRGAYWSGIFLAVFIVLMLGLIGDRYFFQGKIKPPSKSKNIERPYVIIRKLALVEPLTAGKRPTLQIIVQNISATDEVTVEFRDVTHHFSPEAVQTLAYQNSGSPPIIFVMPPTQVVHVRIIYQNFIPTDDQLKALNERRLFLYMFGRGKYSTKSAEYPLSFCGLYDSSIGENLSLCYDNIKFK